MTIDQEGRPHGEDGVTCDPQRGNAPDNQHDYEYVGDEYGSLADGGSYEHYRCRRCGRHAYSPLPD